MTFTKEEIELIHIMTCREQDHFEMGFDASDIRDSERLEYMLGINRLREKLAAAEEVTS